MKSLYVYSTLIVLFTVLITACERSDQDQERERQIMSEKSQEIKNGIELIAELDKTQYALDEEVTVHVKIVNHDQVEKTVSISDASDRIADIIVQHQLNMWYAHFHPESVAEVEYKESEINGILVYTIGPNETIEQTFTWDQQVFDQVGPIGEDNKLAAPSGDYKIMARLAIGEMILQEGETMDEMMQRYSENPLDEIFVNVDFHIEGEREQLSVKEAMEIALQNEEAKKWFDSRTYDHLVKEENGKWFLKDTDGQWVQTNQETIKQLEDVEPHYDEGKREDNYLLLNFNSTLSGPPHRMTVKINTLDKSVDSVDFES